MTQPTYPAAGSYVIPKKNIMVLSCMDLRFSENMHKFLKFDGLQHRYDHVILAGASLLCSNKNKGLFATDVAEKYADWKKTVDDHIEIAKALHDIHDVYIIEHQDCGAYKTFLQPKKVDMSTLALEKKWHKTFSGELADHIQSKKPELNVHSFFIDLRGDVELLKTQMGSKADDKATKTKKSSK